MNFGLLSFSMDEIVGYIERITFQNPENGYTVAQLQQPGHHDLTCVVGSMPGLQPGETVRCQGGWKHHLLHGRQFLVTTFRTEAPADAVGIRKYLGSGLVKGIGPTYAARIVEHFGTETLNIIDTAPDRLLEVPGLGKKRSESILSSWHEQRSIRDVMVFLQSNGISPSYAQKIFKALGANSIDIVKENPYRLARDVHGIGFKKADAIAQGMGIARDSPLRIAAGIEHLLHELSSEGHVCFPLDTFTTKAQEVMEVDHALVTAQYQALQDEERIEIFNLSLKEKQEPHIWLRPLFFAEVGIAREVKRLMTSTCHLRTVDTDKALTWVQELMKIELAPEQHQAIVTALTEKVLIITGGPGTGKSTITKAIIAITEYLTPRIQLAAPTGRAAKRMTEITGKAASTIHSLLEFNFSGGFKRNRDNPLDCDLLIVDEASMIDTSLMHNLLKAVPSYARVVLIGDIHQLPSVGPGNVLRDIILSKKVTVAQLTHIFRQGEGSSIVTNAHKINKGTFPDIRPHPNGDFFFIEEEDPEAVVKTIVSLVSQRLPKKYGLHPIHDIQVLAPMKRGTIGTTNLNHHLQQALNPSETSLMRAGQQFRLGDKVMQIRNDYDKSVFNGDVGTIQEIIHVDQQVIVNFDDRAVVYDFSDLDSLVLAYAISIHKYQGSERRCVVIPIHTSHFVMLKRNMLYTGVTRGKELVIIVGNEQALAIAVRTDDVRTRHTGLQQAIVGTL